ncbi:hypothetical protein L6R50_10800 [Myxococcota bacterium]|nr:hypothetical protein [Myxococcota bacterium]
MTTLSTLARTIPPFAAMLLLCASAVSAAPVIGEPRLGTRIENAALNAEASITDSMSQAAALRGLTLDVGTVQVSGEGLVATATPIRSEMPLTREAFEAGVRSSLMFISHPDEAVLRRGFYTAVWYAVERDGAIAAWVDLENISGDVVASLPVDFEMWDDAPAAERIKLDLGVSWGGDGGCTVTLSIHWSRGKAQSEI